MRERRTSELDGGNLGALHGPCTFLSEKAQSGGAVESMGAFVQSVLITGAAGFIGAAVTDRVLRSGYRVLGLDNLNSYYDVQLKIDRLALLHKQENFEFHQIDLARREEISALFEKNEISWVIHLAAQAGVRYSIDNPWAYVDSNITGFLNILEACRRYSVKHLTYASSSSVYGANSRTPFSEHHSTNHPVSFYAATKKANELMAHSYSSNFKIPMTGLRFFTVYGPWGRPDMAVMKFTNALVKGLPIEIYNHGQLERDFTYIDDVAEMVHKIFTKIPTENPQWDSMNPDPATSYAPYRVYNIGNHQPVNVLEFVQLLSEITGKTPKLVMKEMAQGDVLKTFADVNDIKKDFQLAPKTPLRQGLEKFFDWYKKYYLL